MKKANEDKLVKVKLQGKAYLCVLNETAHKLENAMVIDNQLSFHSYIKKRNMGELMTVTFNAVAEYVVTELTDAEQIKWATTQAEFDMAKKKALPFLENMTFEALCEGK